jgi:hypothetical protein
VQEEIKGLLFDYITSPDDHEGADSPSPSPVGGKNEEQLEKKRAMDMKTRVFDPKLIGLSISSEYLEERNRIISLRFIVEY